MNMTSAETITEIPEENNIPKMTPEQFERFQAKLAKMQYDPEFIRAMQNRRRVKAEYDNLMAMPAEQRAKILFTAYCHRYTIWRDSVERERKEHERKERAN